jgi:hypothetical protein
MGIEKQGDGTFTLGALKRIRGDDLKPVPVPVKKKAKVKAKAKKT